MKKIILSAIFVIATIASVKAQNTLYGSSVNNVINSSYIDFNDILGTCTRTSTSSYGSNSISSSNSYGQSDLYSTNTINVSGYTRSNGTYVESYTRIAPNRTNHDNFSTIGNINPYTGTTGVRAQDYTPQAYNYGVGQTIYTGPRGGQYYINSSGRKTYVPKR